MAESIEERKQRMSGKQKTPIQSNTNIVSDWQIKMDKLKGLKMSDKQREKSLDERFLVDGFLPVGYHVILYGNAGSGKTSVVLKLLADMLEDNADIEVFYFYIDGQLGMASKFTNHIESKNLENRYSILTNDNAETMLTLVEDMLKTHPAPETLVFVLDTLKHLTVDLNNKGANAKALHRIRRIVQTGATFLSLHHTNKDGENFSGTAEIEQDSDALLRIDTVDGTGENEKISTIKEGGRVRFYFKEMSFSFIKGDPVSVQKLEEEIDVSLIAKMNGDKHLIGGLKAFLRLRSSASKAELEQAIKEDDDFEYSRREVQRVISNYVDIHWRVVKSGDRNTTHTYFLLED